MHLSELSKQHRIELANARRKVLLRGGKSEIEFLLSYRHYLRLVN